MFQCLGPVKVRLCVNASSLLGNALFQSLGNSFRFAYRHKEEKIRLETFKKNEKQALNNEKQSPHDIQSDSNKIRDLDFTIFTSPYLT
jgi:hypothetical protein